MLKKKSLSAIIAMLAFVLFAAFVPKAFSASADEITQVTTGFIYEDETATEKTVTGFNAPSVTGDFTIVIPGDVTKIAERAFANNENLTGVVFPDRLKTIGASAFLNTGLKSVSIPASVTEIGGSAFEGCAKLGGLSFGARSEKLLIRFRAFASCTNLKAVDLPDKTEIRQEAFVGCNALTGVTVGADSKFVDISGEDVAFFPVDTNLKIVFPDKVAYDAMLAQEEATFKSKHLSACAYYVTVNCYIGASKTAVAYKQINNEPFTSLPVQNEGYKSTVWYAQRELSDVVTINDLNAMLATQNAIDLYCYETVAAPEFPASVSWVYDKNTSYDIGDAAQILRAMGCTKEYTEQQLAAFEFTVTFKNADGKVLETPKAICESGSYDVTFSLNSAYGEWSQSTLKASAAVNVNTGSFSTVLIVLIVIGALAVIVTVSTAVIRKRVQKKAKKKQISSQEVLDKFRSIGGETNLK